MEAHYDFSSSVNAGYLKQIVPIMARHHIAANPLNYAIVYEYVAGGNPALNQEVDELLSKRQMFDAETSATLYQKHICHSLDSLVRINQQLRSIIAQTGAAIHATCNQAEATNDSFQKKSAILQDIGETEAGQTLLLEAIEEIQLLVASSQNMQRQLNEAQGELESLRNELAQVRHLAETDSLTGLMNRRAFDQTLAELVRRPAKQDTGTCLALLDIDHFKLINDNHGHAIGDNVIKFVAELLKKSALPQHHVARYGGEELAIIMPDTAKQTAWKISEDIRREMENSLLKRKNDHQPLGKITISIGIAERLPEDSAESLIERADKALYRAKGDGRNKVVLG